tara:strand:- start:39727 stop:40233 length:507 start_codon:yes stop_codon:yes gene_type:complete
MTDSPDLQSNTALLRFEGRDEAIPLALSLAQTAKRQICIMGPNIDAILFDSPEFVACLKKLALSSPRAEIKIISQATKVNVQRGHRIIPLAQHLTSSVHIRKPDSLHSNIQNILLLVDDEAYLKCPRATHYEGTACFYDRLEMQGLQSQFDAIWSHSTADMSIRRLHL